MCRSRTPGGGVSQHLRFLRALAGLRVELAACSIAVMLAGCSTHEGPSSVIIPREKINVSSSLSVPLEALPVLVAAYLVIDPLAPNWHLQERALAPDHYLIELRKKRFTTGGDGEAGQVLHRRARALARELGYGGYEILAHAEGIESNVPIAQRVTVSEVRLLRPTRDVTTAAPRPPAAPQAR